MYACMLQLDEYFRNPIDELDAEVPDFRPRLHSIFMARWEYLHVPLMTASYRLEPEFCRRKFSREEQADVRTIFSKLATPEHTLADILSDYADYEDALSMGTDMLNDDVAFSAKAKQMAGYRWAKTYMPKWPDLMYVAVRVLALSCSATGCEDSWSVEGWMHSKKRNRLGQKVVVSALCARTPTLSSRARSNSSRTKVAYQCSHGICKWSRRNRTTATTTRMHVSEW